MLSTVTRHTWATLLAALLASSCSPSLPSDSELVKISREKVVGRGTLYELLSAEVIGRSVEGNLATVKFRGTFRVKPRPAGGIQCDMWFPQGVLPMGQHCAGDQFSQDYSVTFKHFDTGWQFESAQ